MKTRSVWDVVGQFFLLVFFAYGGCLLWYDFSHPELWDTEPLHDPRIYLTFLAVALPPLLLWGWCETRRARMTRRRWQRLGEDYAALKELQGAAFTQRLRELDEEFESLRSP